MEAPARAHTRQKWWPSPPRSPTRLPDARRGLHRATRHRSNRPRSAPTSSTSPESRVHGSTLVPMAESVRVSSEVVHYTQRRYPTAREQSALASATLSSPVASTATAAPGRATPARHALAQRTPDGCRQSLEARRVTATGRRPGESGDALGRASSPAPQCSDASRLLRGARGPQPPTAVAFMVAAAAVVAGLGAWRPPCC
jgi:hypothetical protein